ncbi:hypothetical protein M407DRAFT_102878 [Tulasnella calospora MUT 4182]|uniref:Uncharacterized protein n=1 Tax=Tulasnella calospora MUT 4182 TaxID=1051891 RepID=A0A0C3KS07_9AGAM|nr:hypothetical protein M407DRAFT_102878 [Tulasnella calospora MUT 4182]
MNKTETAYYEEQMKSHVIEIASTAKDQLSFGDNFKGNKDSKSTHGILTWHLLQYLKDNPRPDLHELVSHIYSKCDTLWVDSHQQKWRQVPVLSCSRRIGGRTAFLELR